MKDTKADRDEARRETIIELAHRLFEQKGYEDVGMRDICRAAGLSPPQIYRLGIDKKDLLAEVILRVNQTIIEQVKCCNIKPSESALAFIERYLLSMYELDIGIKSIRAEGAAYGWKWSHKYEALIVEQIHELVAPPVRVDWVAAIPPEPFNDHLIAPTALSVCGTISRDR